VTARDALSVRLFYPRRGIRPTAAAATIGNRAGRSAIQVIWSPGDNPAGRNPFGNHVTKRRVFSNVQSGSSPNLSKQPKDTEANSTALDDEMTPDRPILRQAFEVCERCVLLRQIDISDDDRRSPCRFDGYVDRGL
jgi:hypothetical protein